MNTGLALIAALVITIILVVGAAYVWYAFFGWSGFSYGTGDSPSWLPAGQADLSRLRFKDCVFTVTRSDGRVGRIDVTPNLNSMAVAYKGGSYNPSTLTLTRPLNPFSFVIPGFNDRSTVPDPTVAPWCTSPPASCTGDSGCPYGSVSGACAAGTCVNCPGGATVTLTGRVRTI